MDLKRELRMKGLVVDDEAPTRTLVRDALSQQGYETFDAASGEESLELAAKFDFDLVFCDVMKDGLNGFEVLKALRRKKGSRPTIILMARQASVDDAIEAVRNGADDYICKPFSVEVLQAIAASAIQRKYPNKLVDVQPMDLTQHKILGSSPAMIEVVKNATRVAATDLPVMISGESGTGKELIARLIHQMSVRADMPFVAINCGALPDSLLESELFGHARGAFTGADNSRCGLFEEAHGGTILLDEITETSPAFQVKLLRVLQEGEIRSLGSNAKKKVSVRVLSTTNRDPRELATEGLFRQDLLFRLQGIAIRLPALRERREDIGTMALAFLAQYCKEARRLSITRDALLQLETFHWPGNVRELKHTMQRLAALSSGVIRLGDLPPEILLTATIGTLIKDVLPEAELPTLEQLESSYLTRVLSAVNGNKSRAAEIMGVDRKTLYRMVERRHNAGLKNGI